MAAFWVEIYFTQLQHHVSVLFIFEFAKKKKLDENYDEISVCEVECQSHGDDTDSVATVRLSLIESCEVVYMFMSKKNDDRVYKKTLMESVQMTGYVIA
jgi:hypothetical protein